MIQLIRRVALFFLLVITGLFVLASVAGAQVISPPASSSFFNHVVDLSLVTAVIAILTPILNAFLTHISASNGFKSGVTIVLVALGTITTWATSIVGTVTIKQLAIEAAIALAAAGGILASTYKGTKTLDKVQSVGLSLGAPRAAA